MLHLETFYPMMLPNSYFANLAVDHFPAAVLRLNVNHDRRKRAPR